MSVLLLGTWTLRDWTARADGHVSRPFTARASGRLIYAADGAMAAFLQSPDWPRADPDFSPQRARFIAYGGRYRIEGDVVTHAVDTASDPRWIGVDLVRVFAVTGEQLTIETRPTAAFGIGRFGHHLRWTRGTR